jgi:hypothetical protein
MSFLKKIKKKNGTYVCEVEGYRDEQGRVKHRYIRAVGKLDEKGNLIPRMKVEDVQVEQVKLHGPVHALYQITQDLGLEDLIEDYAPEVMTLVYSHILRPESLNNMKRAITWMDTGEIGLELPVSRKRFEAAMDHLAENIPGIERGLYPIIEEQCNLKTLFYDVTEIYFYGMSVQMAQRGYGTDLPQVGIGLACESDYGIPLFHQLFDGNVYDAQTFPVILARLREFKRGPCTVIFDRGIASKKNISDAIQSGFSVIACLALRGTLKKVAVEESRVLGVQHIVRLSSVFVHAREIETEWEGEQVRMIVCVNKPLQQEIQQNRYHEITEALEKVKKGLKIKDGLKKYIKEEHGEFCIDYEVVQDHEKTDGLYMVLTTTEYPTETVVQKYFERDLIEKSFRSLKEALAIRPVRHWLTRRVRAHIFICYLAYLHLSWMKMLLVRHAVDMSPVKALQKLETIYSVKLTDEKAGASTMKTVPLTKEQEKIYEALNLLS